MRAEYEMGGRVLPGSFRNLIRGDVQHCLFLFLKLHLKIIEKHKIVSITDFSRLKIVINVELNLYVIFYL